jgi:hypothetical protein
MAAAEEEVQAMNAGGAAPEFYVRAARCLGETCHRLFQAGETCFLDGAAVDCSLSDEELFGSLSGD